jgi:hypothetical protein
MNLPDFLILGETKCGTTSLYNYLIQHPQIIDTKGNDIEYNKDYNTKEIRYFDRYYYKGLDWYKNCFYETRDGQITGEATPMYFYRTISINRIKREIPKSKFIILLREPVARLYSNFNHNLKWVPGFRKKYPSFEIFWKSVHDVDYYIIEKGLYYFTLIKWFDVFNASQFCIIKSEDLFDKTQEIYSQILVFLKVTEFRLRDIKIYRQNTYENMDINLRKEIEEFYAPYNAKLYKLLNYKLSWKYYK